MAPKPTDSAIERAKQAGATVTNKLKRKEPKATNRPAPVPVQPVEQATGALAASIKANNIESQRRSDEITKLIATLSLPSHAVRIKFHRDMDPQSPTYLLAEYIDIIPLEAKRKLNS